MKQGTRWKEVSEYRVLDLCNWSEKFQNEVTFDTETYRKWGNKLSEYLREENFIQIVGTPGANTLRKRMLGTFEEQQRSLWLEQKGQGRYAEDKEWGLAEEAYGPYGINNMEVIGDFENR